MSLKSQLEKLEGKKTVKKTTRKKPRTAAQKAATAKLVAMNKARRAKRAKNPDIHIDVNSHNARRSARAKTNPRKKTIKKAAPTYQFNYFVKAGSRIVGSFPTQSAAAEYGQAYADRYKTSVSIGKW